MDQLPYRPCVGVMLFNEVGNVFVAQRIDQKVEAWQMPQGGIDNSEIPSEAALRELKEETNISSVRIIGESNTWYQYDLPKQLVGKNWKGQYRGQTQKWFAMEFLGKQSEIDVNGVKHPEFTKWRWVAPSCLPILTIYFKRRIYRSVVDEFSGFSNALKGKSKI